MLLFFWEYNIKMCLVVISPFVARGSGSNCLCDETKNRLVPKSGVKDIQIYPATIFCDKVEIM